MVITMYTCTFQLALIWFSYYVRTLFSALEQQMYIYYRTYSYMQWRARPFKRRSSINPTRRTATIIVEMFCKVGPKFPLNISYHYYLHYHYIEGKLKLYGIWNMHKPCRNNLYVYRDPMLLRI